MLVGIPAFSYDDPGTGRLAALRGLRRSANGREAVSPLLAACKCPTPGMIVSSAVQSKWQNCSSGCACCRGRSAPQGRRLSQIGYVKARIHDARISFGVTDSYSGGSVDDLLRIADEALLRATAEGRDRIVVAS